MLGSLEQAFQYIQEYTGIVSPGILAIFILGLFWTKTTNKAAIWGAALSIPVALLFKAGSKGWTSGTAVDTLFPSLPWMDQMGYTFVVISLIIMAISYFEGKGQDNPKGIQLNKGYFETTNGYNTGAVIIIVILVFLYSFFW
jgi:SSS family solute:Na+ symporter